MIELSSKISDYLINLFGKEYADRYEEYTKGDPHSYLRFSSLIDDPAELLESLKAYGIKLEKLNDVPFAYRVLEGYDKIGKTIEYSLGYYYIQSLSSMIPPFVLKPNPGEYVMDLCAAPGSKTTQLAEMMKNKGTLVANEPSNKRIRSLVFNIDRHNLVNLGVMRFKGEVLSKTYDHYFDKILVDAPCSGLGIVQKKGEISNWWNTEQVAKISDLQLRLLISAIKMAKVGGEILYSTCTITFEENERIIDRVLKKYPVELETGELPVPSHPGLTECYGDKFSDELSKTRRIVPWEINSEGFFIAKLKKIDRTEVVKTYQKKNNNLRFVSAEHKSVKKYVKDLSDYYKVDWDVLNQYQYLIKNKDIYFLNKEWDMKELELFERLGIKFGKFDKRDFVVLHTHAARLLGGHIKEHLIDVEDDDLKIYLDGGTIKKEYDSFGRKIVRYHGKVIGTAVSTNEGLKSQFPRAMRTHEIVLPE